MDKTIALSGITANSYVDWFISAKQGISAAIQLKGQTRMLVNTGGCYAPIIQGGDDCTDSNLSITIQTNAPVLDISITASDIISDDSVRYGRNFILCANLGNGYNDLYIQVSAWARRNDPMEEKTFVKNLFYQYLSLESHYLFNYIGDTYVQAVCASFDQSVAAGGQLFQDWFRAQYGAVTDTLQKYKLILAALMKRESIYVGDVLSYEQWADMVIAFGTKRWKESKITMESCPFQHIRGVILSKDELDGFLKCKDSLQNECFFPQQITIAASHGSVGAHLKISPTRPLNFRNYGIFVSGASPQEQQDLIAKSIACSAQDASILIFPELSIDEETAPYLIEQLTNASGALKLVVGGSHYPKNPPVQGSYTNSAPIFYKSGSVWTQLAVYDKMIPFSMGYTQSVANTYGFDTGKIPLADYDLLVEDIQITPRVVILPAKDGVIGIAICRDAMDLLDPHNPIHKYVDFVDLMLVISDNTGDSNMFTGVAECLARWHNCATLYTNSVAETQGKSPADNKLEVSFCIYPSKGGPSSTSVAGTIAYISDPFATVSEQQNIPANMVGILFSGSIKYVGLQQPELDNCCKIYKMK